MAVLGLAILCAGLMIYNYCFFYADTKSIYVMKRIRTPWETVRRIVAVPLLLLLIAFILSIVFYWFDAWFYLRKIPKELLEGSKKLSEYRLIDYWRSLV